MEDYTNQQAFVNAVMERAKVRFEGTSLIVRGKMQTRDWRAGAPVFLFQNDTSGVKEYVDGRDPEAQVVKVRKLGSSRKYYSQAFLIPNEVVEDYANATPEILNNAVIDCTNGWQRKFVELFMSTGAVGVDWEKIDGLERTVPWNFSSKHGLANAANLDITGLSYDQMLEAYVRMTEYDGENNKRYFKNGNYMFIMPNRLIPSFLSDPAISYNATGKKFEENVGTFEDSIVKLNLPLLQNVEIFGLPLSYWQENRLYKENVDGKGEGHYGIYCYLVYGGDFVQMNTFGNGWIQGSPDTQVDMLGRQSFKIDFNYNNSMAVKGFWHCGMGVDCVDKNFAVRIECRINNVKVA